MCSYFAIMMILIFVDFNFLNCFMLFCFLLILSIHFFKLIPSVKVDTTQICIQIHKYWNFFLFLISMIAISRYLFQFLSFPLIYQNIYTSTSFDTLMKDLAILGLKIYETNCFEAEKNGNPCTSDPSNLRLGVLSDTLLVFFTLLAKNYLRMVFIYEQKLQFIALSPEKKIRRKGSFQKVFCLIINIY